MSHPAPHRHGLLRVIAVLTGGVVTLGGLGGLVVFGFVLFACGLARGGGSAPPPGPVRAVELPASPPPAPSAVVEAGADGG